MEALQNDTFVEFTKGKFTVKPFGLFPQWL